MNKSNYKTYASLSEQISADSDARLLHADKNVIRIMRWKGTELYDFEFMFYNITKTYLRNLIKFGPSMARKGISHYRDKIARALQRINPENFLMLKHIFLIYNKHDLEVLCQRYGIQTRYNESIRQFNCAAFWQDEQIVVIDLSCLERIHEADMRSKRISICSMDMEVFYTGLFAAIRRSCAQCPYKLPWLDDTQKSEKAVEAWGVETFNQLAEKLAYPWKED